MPEKDLKDSLLVVKEPGTRLDKFITEHLTELSRTQIQKLISSGYVKVNGQIAKAGLKLNSGDYLIVSLPPVTPGTLIPEEIPLNILYEDNDLLVVDKPAGLTVHPAPGHTNYTLVNAILSYLHKLPDTGDPQRPGIVHRLDKDTSGVMLVAKTVSAYNNLIDQFKTRSVTKTYLVVVKGHLSPHDGVIEAAIGRDSRNRERMSVVGKDLGKDARTDYHVIKYIGEYSLLEVKPETGRTHQIRVHLKAIGYPVVGDKAYGIKSPHLTRQFIHAWKIGFMLPSGGKSVEFTTELPQDLTEALEKISN